MNLTGITEFDEVMQKHFVDSVAAAEYVEMEKINSLIDVGTGAGFPGIPLKIVYPHLQVTLLESVSVDEEIAQSKKAVNVLGGEIGKVEKFHLPGSDMERALVVVEKKRSTPKKYPRKAGMPTKEPLA